MLFNAQDMKSAFMGGVWGSKLYIQSFIWMKEWNIFLPFNGITGELLPTMKDLKSFVPSALFKHSIVGQVNLTVNPNFHCSV